MLLVNSARIKRPGGEKSPLLIYPISFTPMKKYFLFLLALVPVSTFANYEPIATLPGITYIDPHTKGVGVQISFNQFSYPNPSDYSSRPKMYFYFSWSYHEFNSSNCDIEFEYMFDVMGAWLSCQSSLYPLGGYTTAEYRTFIYHGSPPVVTSTAVTMSGGILSFSDSARDPLDKSIFNTLKNMMAWFLFIAPYLWVFFTVWLVYVWILSLFKKLTFWKISVPKITTETKISKNEMLSDLGVSFKDQVKYN